MSTFWELLKSSLRYGLGHLRDFDDSIGCGVLAYVLGLLGNLNYHNDGSDVWQIGGIFRPYGPVVFNNNCQLNEISTGAEVQYLSGPRIQFEKATRSDKSPKVWLVGEYDGLEIVIYERHGPRTNRKDVWSCLSFIRRADNMIVRREPTASLCLNCEKQLTYAAWNQTHTCSCSGMILGEVYLGFYVTATQHRYPRRRICWFYLGPDASRSRNLWLVSYYDSYSCCQCVIFCPLSRDVVFLIGQSCVSMVGSIPGCIW